MKTWQIIALMIIGFAVVGLVIFVAITAKNSTTPGSKSSDGNRTTTLPQKDIENLADNFYSEFNKTLGDHCPEIEQANALSNDDLKHFVTYYKNKYKEHPYTTMDNASYWCFWGQEDDNLFEKLKALQGA